MDKTRRGLNAQEIKIIACITMVCSHFGLIFPLSTALEHNLLQGVGRLAMPLFAFMIANGYRHTYHKMHYLARLIVFAVVIQYPYSIFLANPFLNICFMLCLGLISIMAWESNLSMTGKVLALLSLGILAELLNTEYGFYGILMVFTANMFFDYKQHLAMAWVVINLPYMARGFLQLLNGEPYPYLQGLCVLALPLLYFYNGERGNGSRWGFYIFYIGHLAVLYYSRRLILGF